MTADLGIAGKLALVSGHGAVEAARSLRAAGVRIVLTDPCATALDRAARGLDVEAALVADLTRNADVCRIAALMDRLGGCDILIHAPSGQGPAWETEFMSALRLSRPMVPQMLRASWGRVVFLMSTGGDAGPQASLATFAQGIALSYSQRGVTFNTVASPAQALALCVARPAQAVFAP